MVGGGSLRCGSRERGRSSFIGSGVVEQASGELETKGRELKSKLNRLGIQDPLRKRLWKRVDVSHRILTFGHTGILQWCNISTLLRSWFKDVVSHGYISLGV
jgi:hypothetical protein